MVLLHGEYRRKARSAARLYRERFPTGPHPSYQTILSVIKHLRETGCVTSRAPSGRKAKIGREVQLDEVLAYATVFTDLSSLTLWPLKKSGLENPARIRRLSIPTNASACFTTRGSRWTLFMVQLRQESDVGSANILGRCSVYG